MLNNRRHRPATGEAGFTLIELMVVVLIIGILLAIAVPTFLSAQKNAKRNAATSNLRTALSAVKTVHADKQTYDPAVLTVSVLKDAEPSLGWQSAASTKPDQISYIGTDTTMGLAVMSTLGDCFYIYDNLASTGGGTKYGRVNKASNPTCTGAQAVTSATFGSIVAADW